MHLKRHRVSVSMRTARCGLSPKPLLSPRGDDETDLYGSLIRTRLCGFASMKTGQTDRDRQTSPASSNSCSQSKIYQPCPGTRREVLRAGEREPSHITRLVAEAILEWTHWQLRRRTHGCNRICCRSERFAVLVTMPQTLHLQQDRCRNALACFVFDAVEFDRCHHVLKDHTPTVGKIATVRR